MPSASRFPLRLATLLGQRSAIVAPARSFTTSVARQSETWPQNHPIGPFYEAILNTPTPRNFEERLETLPKDAEPAVLPADKEESTGKKKPGRKPKTEDQPKSISTSSAPSSSSSTLPNSTPSIPSIPQEKARIVFGSRLLTPSDPGYEERQRMKTQLSTLVAGVLIPPQPEEPDNCCMSGCVDCVWERYREEMEEWSSKRNEADAKLKTQEDSKKEENATVRSQTEAARSIIGGGGSSMDEDGGGSETNWKIAKDMWDEDVFKGVPVGIREFMKQEKRLKERHAARRESVKS